MGYIQRSIIGITSQCRKWKCRNSNMWSFDIAAFALECWHCGKGIMNTMPGSGVSTFHYSSFRSFRFDPYRFAGVFGFRNISTWRLAFTPFHNNLSDGSSERKREVVQRTSVTYSSSLATFFKYLTLLRTRFMAPRAQHNYAPTVRAQRIWRKCQRKWGTRWNYPNGCCSNARKGATSTQPYTAASVLTDRQTSRFQCQHIASILITRQIRPTTAKATAKKNYIRTCVFVSW